MANHSNLDTNAPRCHDGVRFVLWCAIGKVRILISYFFRFPFVLMILNPIDNQQNRRKILPLQFLV